MRQWAFTETLSKKLLHFYLEWYEHDPHRALRLVLDVLVASSASNPCPETGRAVKDHIVETLVSIVARKSAQQLTKSGLQCLDHFLSKRVVKLTDLAVKYEQVDSSVAGLPTLSLWRSFVFHLFSWMELTYACPLAGKCLVHVFRGLNTTLPDKTATEPAGFTLEVWREWLQDALTRNPQILEDIKNYVLAQMFKTERDASLRLLEIFNKRQPLGLVDRDLTDQGLLLQLAALEIGKKHGMVEEPSKSNGWLDRRYSNGNLQVTAMTFHNRRRRKLFSREPCWTECLHTRLCLFDPAPSHCSYHLKRRQSRSLRLLLGS